MRSSFGTAALVGCIVLGGCGGPDCLTLARRYADHMPDAMVCDPGSTAGQCSDQGPVAVWHQDPEGRLTLTGLGNCMHSQNPARNAAAKAALEEFYANGCRLLLVPFCTSVQDVCRPDAQGGGSCSP